MATPTRSDYRATAEALIEKAHTYAPSSAPRLVYLVEAQVHATLALSVDEPSPKPSTPRSRKAAPAKKAEK